MPERPSFRPLLAPEAQSLPLPVHRLWSQVVELAVSLQALETGFQQVAPAPREPDWLRAYA